MATSKEDLMEIASRDKRYIDKGLNALDHIPDVIFNKAQSVYLGSLGDVGINLPYNLDLYREVRKDLLEAGWKVQSYNPITTYDTGKRVIRLHNNGHTALVWLDASLDNTTCKRIQIGEMAIPVYKVRCR